MSAFEGLTVNRICVLRNQSAHCYAMHQQEQKMTQKFQNYISLNFYEGM